MWKNCWPRGEKSPERLRVRSLRVVELEFEDVCAAATFLLSLRWDWEVLEEGLRRLK